MYFTFIMYIFLVLLLNSFKLYVLLFIVYPFQIYIFVLNILSVYVYAYSIIYNFNNMYDRDIFRIIKLNHFLTTNFTYQSKSTIFLNIYSLNLTNIQIVLINFGAKYLYFQSFKL